MKRLKKLLLLLICLTTALTSCSISQDKNLPDGIKSALDTISQSIKIKDKTTFLKCIDEKNREFYAEEKHMFEDIETLTLRDFKLEAEDFSIYDNNSYKVRLKQCYTLDGKSHTFGFSGIFRLSGDRYVFSDLYFDSIETVHFIIKFPPSLKNEGSIFADLSEKAYGIVKDVYRSEPSGKTVVKLYDNNEVFSFYIKPSVNFLMAGWYEYPESIKINLSPEVSGKNDEDVYKDRYLKIIAHELTHRTSIIESGNNMPYWMAEGIATYVEQGGPARDSNPQRTISQIEQINLEKLSERQDISMYYSDSYANISLFIKKFGLEKLHTIISKLGSFPLQEKTGGQSIDENNGKFHKVLKSVMSMTVEQLDRSLSEN